MEKLRKLAVSVDAAVAGLELQFSSPSILQDLIQIPLVLQRVIQPHRLVLVLLIHPPIVAAFHFKKKNFQKKSQIN